MILRLAVLTALITMSLAASSFAANITFGLRSEPTPGLPDYTTWTIYAVSDQPMQGFDFAGDGSNDPATARGFFVPMNQVNPFGLPTVYSDYDVLFPFIGLDFKQDSHFLVRTSDVVVPAGLAEESDFHLQAVWAHAMPVGKTSDIVQLVTRDFGFSFRGVITTLEGTSIVENRVSGAFAAGPLFNVVDGTLEARNDVPISYTFTTDTQSPFLEWGNFTFNGPRVAIPPTFNPETQQFKWNPAGSALGIYTAMVTVTDVIGNSDTGTLTIRLVPEPASCVLAGLAIAGCLVSCRRSGQQY